MAPQDSHQLSSFPWTEVPALLVPSHLYLRGSRRGRKWGPGADPGSAAVSTASQFLSSLGSVTCARDTRSQLNLTGSMREGGAAADALVPGVHVYLLPVLDQTPCWK